MATHSSILAWRLSMDRGAWRATVHEMAKSRTQLSDWTVQRCTVLKDMIETLQALNFPLKAITQSHHGKNNREPN